CHCPRKRAIQYPRASWSRRASVITGCPASAGHDGLLAPPALHAHRQHLVFDPVSHLADTQLLVEHILADAVAPGQPLAGRVAIERVKIAGEFLDLALVGEEALADQARADAPHDGREFPERIFGMILH